MFKVLSGRKKTNYAVLYTRLFQETLNQYTENSEDRNCIKRLSYYGVKAVNELVKVKENTEYERINKLYEFIEVIKIAISLMTPNEMLTVFPIDKKYDGDKYEIKDYFYTMNELQKIGMNNIIAGQIDYLLWDYMNTDINRFLVNSMSISSDIYKRETGYGILDKWAEENCIGTYKLCKDETTGKQYLFDSKTGRSTAMKQAIPKHLKVIK